MENWSCRTCHGVQPATTEYFTQQNGKLIHWCKVCKRDYERAYKLHRGEQHRVNLTREAIGLLVLKVVEAIRADHQKWDARLNQSKGKQLAPNE